MSTELIALTLATVWQMVVFVLYATPANRELGPGFTTSPRDRAPSRQMSTGTARLQGFVAYIS